MLRTLTNYLSFKQLMPSVKRTFSDLSWEQHKSMGINTNLLSQFDSMTTLQNNSSWFAPRAYNFPSFGFWQELQESLPAEQATNLVRNVVTPWQWCHHCSNWCNLPRRSVLQHTVEGHCCLSPSFSPHNICWHYESQPAGVKFPAWFDIDFSTSRGSTVWCLQQ